LLPSHPLSILTSHLTIYLAFSQNDRVIKEESPGRAALIFRGTFPSPSRVPIVLEKRFPL